MLEPTTVVAKAWEPIAAVGQRAFWEPRTVVVTGAGPIGLLAALLGKLGNNVIVGSVNANEGHGYKAGVDLARADRSWLARLVTRRERPENFAKALARTADDIKVVVQFADA